MSRSSIMCCSIEIVKMPWEREELEFMSVQAVTR